MLAEIAKKEQADITRTARANRVADDTAVASAAAISIPGNGADAASPSPTQDPSQPLGMATQSLAGANDPTAAPAADMSGQSMAQATTPADNDRWSPARAVGDSATTAMPTDQSTSSGSMASESTASDATKPAGASLEAAAAADRIRAQQNAFQARQYVEQAKQAQAGQRLEDARSLYESALKLDPSNEQAQQGRSEVLALTGNSPAQADAFTDYTRALEQKRSAVNFSVQAALEEARMARQQGDYAAAGRALIRAQAARDSDPGIFKQQELAAFDSAIRTETAANDRASAAAAAADRQKTAEAAIQRESDSIQRANRERQSTIASLIKQSRTLTQQGRNKDALKIIDQILTIDPRNDYALGVRPLIYDRIQLGNQRKTMEDLDRNVVDILNMAEEQRVPIPDLLTYPTDWPDLSARREETTSRERGGATDQATEAILAKQLPELRFDSVPFTDVIDFLRDTTQANIFVNWTAIEGAGIDKNTPISTRLTNVRFSKVLEIILDSAGGGVTRLGYTIDDGVITISTNDDLAKNVATRTYDIRDLLVQIPRLQGPAGPARHRRQGRRRRLAVQQHRHEQQREQPRPHPARRADHPVDHRHDRQRFLEDQRRPDRRGPGARRPAHRHPDARESGPDRPPARTAPRDPRDPG